MRSGLASDGPCSDQRLHDAVRLLEVDLVRHQAIHWTALTKLRDREAGLDERIGTTCLTMFVEAPAPQRAVDADGQHMIRSSVNFRDVGQPDWGDGSGGVFGGAVA